MKQYFNEGMHLRKIYSSSDAKIGPISKQQILNDAEEALNYRSGLHYQYVGVFEDMSEISLDDFKSGNYSDDDRITFKVDVSYRGNTSFVPVEYEYMNGEWSCITTDYDFSSEAAEILREIKYPLS